MVGHLNYTHLIFLGETGTSQIHLAKESHLQDMFCFPLEAAWI